MPKKNPNAGRKLFDGKATEKVVSKLEEAFEYGATDDEACLHADISTAALYRYEKANPKFRERKQRLKLKPILLARSSVVSALKGSPELSLKFLERKVKDEFSLRHEHTGKDGKDLPRPILSGPAEDEPTEESTDVPADHGAEKDPAADQAD